MTATEVQRAALSEFDGLVGELTDAGVDVIIIEDTQQPRTPDSIFPNNWVSFHENGAIILYPMFAPNRRRERRRDMLGVLREKGFEIRSVIDLTDSEDEGRFLEGTGSLVLDRENRIAYAGLSLRTDASLVQEWANLTGYETVVFNAVRKVEGLWQPIYHTNVMMSVADKLAIICADSIRDQNERKQVLSKLEATGKKPILLSERQTARFAGNMLQVGNREDENIMVMSTQAYNCLTRDQIATIEESNRIVHSPLDVIETLSGGSARCMIAEVFLPSQR